MVIAGLLRPSIDDYAFCASVIVLVYLIARFLLFSNAHPMHPGQDWIFKGYKVRK